MRPKQETEHYSPLGYTHTRARRRQQRMFSQTPEKPAVKASISSPQEPYSKVQEVPVADRFQFSGLSSVSQTLNQRLTLSCCQGKSTSSQRGKKSLSAFEEEMVLVCWPIYGVWQRSALFALCSLLLQNPVL